MAVEFDVLYEGGLRCTAIHGPSQIAIATDAPVENGGKGAAFSPTDLVAVATATCMVTIMGIVADREKIDIAGTRLHTTKEMVADPVRRIGTIKVTVTLPAGRAYTPAQRAKLEGGAKACPVKHSLHPDVNVVMEFVYPE